MKNLSKQKKTIIYSSALLAIVSLSFLTYNFIAKGATYGWLQATWSGGASTDVATHTSNQTLWDKFFSKDTNVDTANDQLTLSSGSSSVVQTTTTDFNSGTKSGLKLDTSTVANQVTVNFNYYDGSACGLYGVYYQDVSSTKQWKTSGTTCASPQCSGGVLVADNAVDFSLYPARDACKALGGVLPTMTELQCMYNNRASFGNNFVANYYWSANEFNSETALYFYFSNGTTGAPPKTYAYHVRCVRR